MAAAHSSRRRCVSSGEGFGRLGQRFRSKPVRWWHVPNHERHGGEEYRTIKQGWSERRPATRHARASATAVAVASHPNGSRRRTWWGNTHANDLRMRFAGERFVQRGRIGMRCGPVNCRSVMAMTVVRPRRRRHAKGCDENYRCQNTRELSLQDHETLYHRPTYRRKYAKRRLIWTFAGQARASRPIGACSAWPARAPTTRTFVLVPHCSHKLFP